MKSLSKRLWIFDFDDTLVTTDCRTLVIKTDGTRLELTPAQYTTYEVKPGDVFDYTQFRQLINPRELTYCMSIMRRVYRQHGPENIAIISARNSVDPIMEFLLSVNMSDIETSIMPPDPHYKAEWIDGQIVHRGLNMVQFFDDAIKNVQAVEALRAKHPDVELTTWHIVDGQPSSSRWLFDVLA